ncbi:translation elongation factor Ts [Candidatus Wolfebacteria bacterium]|nr:translation elongation factor Ts [Candidatus Wolfebacteria bacterium]
MINNVQKLRDATGAGVMDCKKALVDADGNFDKAAVLIRERGLIKAEKKSERKTGTGLIESYVHNERVGVLMEIRCETDFVARSEVFRELARNLTMQIAAMNPENIEELLKQAYVKDESLTVEEIIKQAIAKLGENIRIEKICRYEI